MDTNILLGGAAFGGLLATLWHQLQTLMQQAAALLVDQRRCDSAAGVAVLHYLHKTTRGFDARPNVDVGTVFTKDAPRPIWTPYLRPGDNSVHVVGRGLVWRTVATKDSPESGCVLSCLRGTVDLDALIVRAVKYRETAYREVAATTRDCRGLARFKTVMMRGRSGTAGSPLNGNPAAGTAAPQQTEKHTGSSSYGASALWPHGVTLLDRNLGTIYHRAVDIGDLDHLVLSPEGEAMLADLRRWFSARERYQQHGIAWRRGYGLYGPSGSGKTSLVVALGQALDMPILCYDLSTMNNEELHNTANDVRYHAPCLLLFEDIDCVYTGRDRRTEYIGPTYDALLNFLGGAAPLDGAVTVITTNHAEAIDSAMGVVDARGQSSRPGRIDRVFKIGLASEHQRTRLAAKLLAEWPERQAAIVDEGTGDTIAQFSARCHGLALSLLWDDDGRAIAPEETHVAEAESAYAPAYA